jgi:hypothetical protein
MTLSQPFSSCQLDHKLVLKTLLEQAEGELCKWTLEALVVSDKGCREWYIGNNFLKDVYKRVIKSIKSKEENVMGLKKDIESFGSLCYDN